MMSVANENLVILKTGQFRLIHRLPISVTFVKLLLVPLLLVALLVTPVVTNTRLVLGKSFQHHRGRQEGALANSRQVYRS